MFHVRTFAKEPQHRKHRSLKGNELCSPALSPLISETYLYESNNKCSTPKEASIEAVQTNLRNRRYTYSVVKNQISPALRIVATSLLYMF